MLGDNEAFIDGKRSRAGMSPAERRERGLRIETMLFRFVDDDKAGGQRPPDHVQSAFEDVFGRDRLTENGEERLKLFFHPVLKRWCMLERHYDPLAGENFWQVISRFQEEVPHDNYLPDDLKENKFVQQMEGLIGDYRLPNKRDFEEIERFDSKKYTPTDIENMVAQRELDQKAALDSDMESFDHDFVSYYGWQLQADANQRAGAMRQAHFICNPDIYEYKHNAWLKGYKYKTSWVQSGPNKGQGYFVRVQRTIEEQDRFNQDLRELAAAAAEHKEKKRIEGEEDAVFFTADELKSLAEQIERREKDQAEQDRETAHKEYEMVAA